MQNENNQNENIEAGSAPRLLHCQNCQTYAKNPDTELKPYGAFVSCCKTCRQKLEAIVLKKSQISFEFAIDQPPLFLCLLLCLFVALSSACGSRVESKAPETNQRQALSVQNNTGDLSSSSTPETIKAPIYCEAPTKAGGKCRRRVKEKGARCFMHNSTGVNSNVK